MANIDGQELLARISPYTFYQHFGFEIKQANNNYHCPFHDDKTPSLFIRKADGVFNCFGCNKHGDMIQFWIEKYGVGFKDAIAEMATIFNIDIGKAKQDRKREKKGEWIVKPLKLIDIDLEIDVFKEYFERKGITKPEKIKEKYGLKWCENNQAIALPLGKRYKLIAIDERGHRWDISEEPIQVQYINIFDYQNQPSLLLIEGISNLWALECEATEEFNKKYFTICSTHGVSSTLKLQASVIFKEFKEITICLDNDKAGREQSAEILKEYPEANDLVLDEKDIRDHLKTKGFKSFVDILEKTKSFNNKVKELVENLKQTPDKLKELIDDIHKLGIVGETVNIALIFLCMISYKLDSCIGFILKGHYSSGKSKLMNTIAKLMPPGIVLFITSLSKQALNYMGDLSHKILLETEAHRSDDIDYWEIDSQLRQLITEHEITRAVTEKDEKTSKCVTVIHTTKGPISYGTTTTQDKTKDENESRLFVLRTNDSYEHLQSIKEMLDKKAMGLGISNEEQKLTIAKWQKFIEQLPAFKLQDIVIPYSQYLGMKYFGAPVSREYEKLLKIIKVYTWFNNSVADGCLKFDASTESPINSGVQASCDKKYSESNKLISTIEDYRAIYPLVKEFFDSIVEEIDQETQRDFEMAKKTLTPIWTRVMLSTTLHKKRDATEKLIAKWIKHNMAEKIDKSGAHNANRYKLNREWKALGAELVKPEDITKKLIDKEISSLSIMENNTATDCNASNNHTSSCCEMSEATGQQLEEDYPF